MAEVKEKTKGVQTRKRIIESAKRLILDNGYGGTSLDDILNDTGLSKGAFFYHFSSKENLAVAVAEDFWEEDFAGLVGIHQRAEALVDDPLERVLLSLKLLAEMFDSPEAPGGCLFASYVYELGQFDSKMKAFIADGFDQWKSLYEGNLRLAIEQRMPDSSINASELAEMIVSVVEGAFVVSRTSHEKGRLISRQLRNLSGLLGRIFKQADAG